MWLLQECQRTWQSGGTAVPLRGTGGPGGSGRTVPLLCRPQRTALRQAGRHAGERSPRFAARRTNLCPKRPASTRVACWKASPCSTGGPSQNWSRSPGGRFAVCTSSGGGSLNAAPQPVHRGRRGPHRARGSGGSDGGGQRHDPGDHPGTCRLVVPRPRNRAGFLPRARISTPARATSGNKPPPTSRASPPSHENLPIRQLFSGTTPKPRRSIPWARLVYRSNLLGGDQRITNTGGGNTSSKIMEADPLDA